MKPFRIFIIALILLLAVKSIVVWYGFDRLPPVSINDEATFNDPAFWMAKGEGLIAKGLEGDLGMEKVYAQFPPLYFALQASIIHFFGLSTITIRGSNMILFIVYIGLLLTIFYHLRKNGIYDNFSVFWTSFLLMTEPTIFSFCRMGRPESLGISLAMLAFLLLLSGKGLTDSSKRWAISAILIGLSASAHFEMVFFYVIYAVLIGFKFRNKNRRSGLILLLLPALEIIFIWIAVHGARSWDALDQFCKLYSYLRSCKYLQGFKIDDLCRDMLSRSFQSFNQGGGLAFILICFSLVMVSIRIFNNFRHRSLHPAYWNGWLFTMGLFAVIEFLILALYFGTRTQRVITIFPVALIGLGVAISHLEFNRLSRHILVLVLGSLVITGLAGHGMYLYKVHREWNERDPSRFSHIVNSIPIDKKIATVCPLWFEFTRSGRIVRLVDTGVPYDNDCFSDPETVNKYDVIILFSRHIFINTGYLSNKKSKTITVGGVDFTVFQNEEYI